MKQDYRKNGTARTGKRIAAFVCAFLMLGWVLCFFLTVFAKSEEPTEASAEESVEQDTEDGALPVDDTTALVSCSMEDVQEDYENEKIESALFESGYFRSDIPLDGDTQAYLRAACEESGVTYELALAVIWKETGYQNITGDGGDSVGYMQIQPKWHWERMNRLGVDDLSEPYGNFRVGCDYLAELLSKYDTDKALTAYNTGKPAKSNYATEVLLKYHELRETALW